jgi:uncharacterized protein
MSRPSPSNCILMVLFLAFAGNAVLAQDTSPKRGDPTIDPKLVAAGFLDSHPDLLHRSRGLDAYGRKDHAKAFEAFRRAAYFSDKPSQAILGEMLWIGLGTEKDRALAYIWMSLAAERGYTSFSTKRDHYWQELDEQEQARAEAERDALWADYSDASAGPRLEAVLLREYRRATGSRLGSSTSPLQIVIPGVGSIDGSQYYQPKYWDPVQYRQWQDSIWMDVRIGRVTTSELQPVGSDQATGHPAVSPAGDPMPSEEP